MIATATILSMRDTAPGDWAAALLRRQRVTAQDVAHIRFDLFPLGLANRADAEKLFAIEGAILDKAPAWAELFEELLTDFVIWGERPTGTITPSQAEWVLAQVDCVSTGSTLSLLLGLSQEAHTVPTGFSSAVRLRMSRDWRGAIGMMGQAAA